MERVIVFLDYANVNDSAREHGGLDYAHLLQYLAEDRFLVDGYCYLPVDPRRQAGHNRTIDALWEQGWNVQAKVGKIAGDSYKCNVDVEMVIDMLRAAHGIRPDIMVLCSGDEDFLPLVHEVRHMGIRVEVAAFEDAAARRLRQQASGFISLDHYLQEWLAEREAQDAQGLEVPAWADEQGNENGLSLQAPLEEDVPAGEIQPREIPSADRYR